MTYCTFYNPTHDEELRQICQDFVDLIKKHSPEMLKKPTIHLMLHIVDSMRQFGATSAYNTERLVHVLNTVSHSIY